MLVLALFPGCNLHQFHLWDEPTAPRHERGEGVRSAALDTGPIVYSIAVVLLASQKITASPSKTGVGAVVRAYPALLIQPPLGSKASKPPKILAAGARAGKNIRQLMYSLLA